MSGATETLARYAANLRYEDIPPEVLQRAKNTIADGVGAIIFGYDLPWSRIVVDHAVKYGGGGTSHILGLAGPRVQAPMAALANGALAHAFELDGATKPSFGVHPCATVIPAALAIAQECGGDGRAILTAFVAATEVMVRIGRGTGKSNEHRGFHGPGTTGPFGAALGAGLMMGLDAGQLTNALGLAASLACGIVQFTRSGTGTMVKRLHFGRANESGVLAASLASRGYTGPHDAIEGDLGFLRVFCDEYDESALTKDLGKRYDTLGIYMKRFACHGSAQIPLQVLLDLRTEHGFSTDDIATIEVSANEERVDRHDQREPTDPMLAQYSVPFSVAVACYRDPRDPRAFDETALHHAGIREMTRRIRYFVSDDPEEQNADINTVTVVLRDGRRLSKQGRSFLGMPNMPATADDVFDKFSVLTRHCPKSTTDELFARIQNMEKEPDLHWLHV